MNKTYTQALKVLKHDGVIIYPTDTTYGIGCNISSSAAVNRIFEIKGRNFDKPFSIACCDINMVSKYAEIDGINPEFLKAVFPGAVTLLMPKKESVSDVITAGSDMVGVRVPDYPELLELIKFLSEPIITTSANISGHTDPIKYEDVKIMADYIIRGLCTHMKASTIINCSTRQIVRQGAESNRYQKLISKYLY